jgi:Ricin-type beta-trefoil lectin domain-like
MARFPNHTRRKAKYAMTPVHVRSRLFDAVLTPVAALFALMTTTRRGTFRTVGIASGAIVLLLSVTIGTASAKSDAPGNHAKNAIFNAAMTSFCSLKGNVYKIKNLNSGLSLEVHGASKADGANVDQWAWTGGANEKWCRFPTGGTTTFVYINMNSGKCLEVHGNSKTRGANVDQWDCISGAANEEWIDLGGVLVVSNASGLVLDMKGASKRNGGNADVWTPNGRSNQIWPMWSGY